MKTKPNATNEFDVEGAKAVITSIQRKPNIAIALDYLYRIIGFQTRNLEEVGFAQYYDQDSGYWLHFQDPTTNASDAMEWLPEDCGVNIHRYSSQARYADDVAATLESEAKWHVELWKVSLQIFEQSQKYKSLPLAIIEAILLFYIAKAEAEKVDIPAAVS